MKALIVDDSLVIRSIIEKIVTPMGYETLKASNGQEALDLLEKNAEDVELVILDWNMPLLNGWETLSAIKKNRAYDHVCIIMVSTEAEDEKIDQAIGAGAHGYISKPFEAEELIEKIKVTLEKVKGS